jgi:hypothetical protein
VEARYLTDENGKRIGVVLDIKEYERLLELEDEMEDVRRYGEAVAERERGESDAMPPEQAVRETSKERKELGRRGEL